MAEQQMDNEQKVFDEVLLINLLEQNDFDTFREEYFDLHPYDRAQFYFRLEPSQRVKIYEYLSPEEMGEIMENIDADDEDYEPLFAEMNPQYAADLLSHMYTDDAVDVLNELDKDQVASYLTIMDKESAEEIKNLLHYEEYTAGSIMTTEFVSIPEHSTVRSAMAILRNKAPGAETIYYTFVINEDRKLVGVVSLRDLITSDEDVLIKDIMSERVVSVSVGDDQEDVARTMKDYDFLALPVVDFQNHLLGIITVDDIIDVLEEEASDDYSKLAGISDMDSRDRTPFRAARKRLPWLIALLFLGMMTANLIGRFEDTLEQVAILAVFIPLIAGMAGNTGTQALAVAVRSIATGDIKDESKMKLILREAGTGFITGSICGVIVIGIVYVWQDSFFLGVLVGISIFASLIVATLAGSLVPLVMHRFNIDPAVASGPFITTINDIISILIYFGIATSFMSYL
ncbi:magnesium transporter [Jeotgalibacillus sp. R-1-5s-1]|uniref:magnesium transporter n=1 Tax=Jeotgalibacillus sp. R-1-5s-1 TaxID=2555897 RepID=UPI00106AF88F|nr:magnesium transporter [Jeotgalibacillus sp. R-1-5s-1]TFD97587.1 magnesium transporter [Jeotgalibacillus sp. R-1-5s-1]